MTFLSPPNPHAPLHAASSEDPLGPNNVRNSTGTLNAGEQTVFFGTTPFQTLTLPASAGAIPNTITNISTQSVTIAPNAGQFLIYYGVSGSFVLPPGEAITFGLFGITWYGSGAFISNAVTVTSNAGTVTVANPNSTFTNTSAATMAITMGILGAVDGLVSTVRIYDFSAAAQTIGWTNTENSIVSVPTTSNGSTTLPLTVQFIYNSKTSKWRCVLVA